MTEFDKKPEEKKEPNHDEGIRQRWEGLVPDLIRRTVVAGMGALFTSEESIRKLANEFSLPKDVASYLISQAQVTKDEASKVVAREVRKFLESMNFNEELARLLTRLTFEINTQVRILPNEDKIGRPEIKQKVSVKLKPEDGETASESVDSPNNEPSPST
ncbi:MAG: hypothetical protein V1754_04770 [Pseudomonadota bacterium]